LHGTRGHEVVAKAEFALTRSRPIIKQI
jgi:hypothetical protein